MEDREMLELAAKAAGMNVQRSRLNDPLHRDFLINGIGIRNPGQTVYQWNPLIDDGDAFRLAVNLKLCISQDCYDGKDVAAATKQDDFKCYEVVVNEDCFAATRRAVVRAAAEIGKAMP